MAKGKVMTEKSNERFYPPKYVDAYWDELDFVGIVRGL